MKTTTAAQDNGSGADRSIALSRSTIVLFLMIACGAIVMAAPLSQAQTFQVLHAFTGLSDDASPESGLIRDGAGNFYGTTSGVPIGSNGTVFQLKAAGSGWVLDPLRNFGRLGDGPAKPVGDLTIGPDGALYGTTFNGGTDDVGTVFKLQPPPQVCASFSCPWTVTVIHNFAYTEGIAPVGALVFDRAGNLYGATEFGGYPSCAESNVSCGIVYELSPSGSGWTEKVLYEFSGSDGAVPSGGLTFDTAGNLYGVTWLGGVPSNSGVLYKLSPAQGGGWTETVLYEFGAPDSGALPIGNLIWDGSGNLYGEAEVGGSNDGGTVFQFSARGSYQDIYSFSAGSNAYGPLIFDVSGNLYGTTSQGGSYGYGTAFKLVPSHGSWSETDLHVFQAADGIYPNGGLTLDSAGNLYGTAQSGGHFSGICNEGCGTLWKITQ